MQASGLLFASKHSPTLSRFRVFKKHDLRNSNIAAKQKAVYSWYESRSKDDDIDIYSPRWQHRLKNWHDWVEANHSGQEIDLTQEVDDDFDLRTFFFQDPIAAYSLWHVLQACFELDIAVCGAEAGEAVKKWQELPPFTYLKSLKVKNKWKIALKKLSRQIQNEELEVEEWTTSIYDIHLGIDKLEDSVKTLEENFCAELECTTLKESILDSVVEVFESRCNMIADSLNPENEREAADGMPDAGKLSGDDLGKSPKSPRKSRVAAKKHRTRKQSSQSFFKSI